MTPKQRVKTAMCGGVPDHVPVIPQLCHPHAIRMLGLDFERTLLDVVRNPRLGNELVLQCARQYGLDGIRTFVPGDPLDVVNVDGTWYGVDPKTGERLERVDFEGGGSVLPSEEPSIRTDEDIDSLPVPTAEEILASGRLDGIRRIIAEVGDEFFVATNPGACTVEYLTLVRGKAQAMMDLVERPDFCHKALSKAVDIAIQRALALRAVGMDAFMIGDTYGGIVSPAMFREFILPYAARFVAEMEKLGVITYFHTCGNSTRVLELLADSGVDCVEPLDPLGGVSVADAKSRIGHRVALMGGVNTVLLARGTLDEVKADVDRCLAQGAPGGGYILACGDMLPTETAPEKVHAMVRAAREYTYA